MGRLNELLGPAANYSRGVAAHFGLQEQEGVPTVAPELVPTSDIHARPEQWALHGGTLLWGRTNVSSGGAGNRSQAAIQPGDNELVIVEKIVIFPQPAPAGGQSYFLVLSTVALTSSTGNLVSRDARRIVTTGGTGASSTRLRTQNNAPVADIASTVGVILVADQVGAHSAEFKIDCVLVAPWTLRLLPGADNTGFDATWWVRVRPGTERELTIGNL